MASGPKPVGEGSSTRTHEVRDIELSAVKGLSGHTVTDKTGQVKDFSDKVPRQNFRNPGGTFSHRISLAFEKGGLGYVLWLIASSIFPFIKPPPLFNSPAENLEISFQLNQLAANGKKIGDPEVQAFIKRIFPDTSSLEKEWASMQKKSPQEIQRFLVRVEERYQAIAGIDLGAVDFVDEAKKEALANLDKIRQPIAEHLVGKPAEEWRGKLTAVKQFPIDKDPVVLLNFYAKLEAKIAEMHGQDTTQTPSLKSALQSQVDQLEAIKSEVKGEVSRRLVEVKGRIAGNLPVDLLQATAKQAGVKLPEGSYGEQAQFLQDEIAKKRKEANQEFANRFDEGNSLEKKIAAQSKQLVVLEEDLARLSERRQNQADAVTRDIARQLVSAREQLPPQIAILEESIRGLEKKQKDLQEIQAGRATEGLFRTKVAFTESKKRELDTVDDRLKMQREDLGKLKAKVANLGAASDRTEAESIKKIDKDFVAAVGKNQEQITQLRGSITRNQEAQKLAEQAREQAFSLEKRFGQLETEFKSSWLALLNVPEMRSDCKLLSRLTFLEGVFDAYQTTAKKGQEPWAWVGTYYTSDTKQAFEKTLSTSLGTLGVRADSSAFKEAMQEASQVIVRNTEPESTKKLGLQEFQ